MEKLPPVGEKRQIPYTLPIHPFLLDHRIPSGAVLPAVHSMQVLVDFISHLPAEFNTRTLCNASFGKLLHLPDNQESKDTWIEMESLAEAHLRIALLSKSRSKSGIVRSFPHAVFDVYKAPNIDHKSFDPEKKPQSLKGQTVFRVIPGRTRTLGRRYQIAGFKYRTKPGMAKYFRKRHSKSLLQHKHVTDSVPVSDIYPGLVCFAESFQNVVKPVKTHKSGAMTTVSGGKPVPGPNLLGSPFPLDAAFQAACAWGKKYTRRICYPVAFVKRVVFKPTQALEEYDVAIRLLRQESGTLEFDLVLKNSQCEVMELVEGLKMREIGL